MLFRSPPPHHPPTAATSAAIATLEVNPADVTIAVEKESHASTISTKISPVPFFYLHNPTESDRADERPETRGR